MADTIKVFIGYDENETVAFHVLAHSIMRHASKPVEIVPVVKSHMSAFYTRERSGLESTDFSFSRFLAPYLCDYKGWAIFTDCDMLVTADIAELWALRDDKYAVMCAKHDYQPVGDTKFLGQVQTKYEKKNWSSVMMFNNARCTALTPEVVSTETGLYLHRQTSSNDGRREVVCLCDARLGRHRSDGARHVAKPGDGPTRGCNCRKRIQGGQ
jgi:hypothetical protein